MVLEIRIRFDARTQLRWIFSIHADVADADGNLGCSRGFLKSLLNLFRIAGPHLVGSIDNQLGSIGSLFAESTFVGILAFGQRRRGVGIFPAIVVPIGYVFT